MPSNNFDTYCEVVECSILRLHILFNTLQLEIYIRSFEYVIDYALRF